MLAPDPISLIQLFHACATCWLADARGFDPLTDCIVVVTIGFGRLQYRFWRGKACLSPFTEPVERPLQDARQFGNKAISQPFVLLRRRYCYGKLDYPNSPPNGFSRPGNLWEIVGCQPQFELWVELEKVLV